MGDFESETAARAATRAARLLLACGTPDAVMPATLLFNEGWMLRLVLDWFDRHRARVDPGHPLAFVAGARWYSEVLLGSQFRPRWRGDDRAESWTHADAAIGHFRIGGSGQGDLVLAEEADQLVIIEAKMFSPLSDRTKNAPGFDQASRSVACLVEALVHARRPASAFTRLGFLVLAPAAQVTTGVFARADASQVTEAVRARVAGYANNLRDPEGRDHSAKVAWFERHFLPAMRHLRIDVLAWESIVADIIAHDPVAGAELAAFLGRCLAGVDRLAGAESRRPRPSL